MRGQAARGKEASAMTDFQILLERLSEKWHEVPTSRLERLSTRRLAEMPDDDLLKIWEKARADTCDGVRALNMRGWIYEIYGPWARGRKVLEVGSGIGIDAVAFARMDAAMTLVDISRTNLEIVRRIWVLKGLGRFTSIHLTDHYQLDGLPSDYDAVFAFGSLHHMPADLGKPEFDALARRLKPGGRFVMHAYPKQRWIDEGSMAFDKWGEKTDGAGTPWAEWYDSKKLIAQLRPAHFAPLLYCEYAAGTMCCIDLKKIDGEPSLTADQVPPGSRELSAVVSMHELAAVAGIPSSVQSDAGGSISITTTSPQWAYAAEARIHREHIPSGTTTLALRVRMTVEAGRIGIGILKRDGSAFLAEEFLEEDDIVQFCVVTFDNIGEAGSLILRNASPKGAKSIALVHSIQFFQVV
jgi:SAM-dependent methyltransferase